MAGMRIPDTPLGGQRVRGIPDVDMGPRLNADDFGANHAREMARFGEVVQRGGDAMQRYGIKVYEERAQSEATEALAKYKTDTSRYRDQIFINYTGDKAYLTPDDLDTYARNQAGNFAKELKTPRAIELFDEGRLDYDAHNKLLADQHVLKQHEQYRVASIDADNAQLLNEAAALPGEPAVVMESIHRIEANNAEKFRGAPPEYLAIENRRSAMAVAETVAANLAARDGGPQAALAFLDSPKIKELFTDAEFEKRFGRLREKYETANRAADALASGRQWAKDGLTGTQLLDAAFEKFGEHPEQMGQAITFAKQYQAEQEHEKVAANKDLSDTSLTDLAKNDYRIDSIPENIRIEHPEVYGKLVQYSSFIKSHGEKPMPDTMLWQTLMSYDPEMLRLMFQDEAAMMDYRLRLGDGPWWHDVEARARGNLSPDEKAAAKGKGKGAFGLSDVKPTDLSYADELYLDSCARRNGGKLPDEKDEAEKLRRIQFSLRARETLAEAMNAKGGVLTPLETKAVLYPLLQTFKFDKPGVLYGTNATDVQAFEMASDPEKYKTVTVTGANNEPVTGDFGGNLELDTKRNRLYETVKSSNEAAPAEVRAAAKIAEKEGGDARFDRQENLFIVSFNNRLEFYNRAGKLVHAEEAAARDMGKSTECGAQ